MEMKTILLVEDNVLVAMATSVELEAYGYTVFHAGTGQAAIDIVQSKNPEISLILMDINLGKGIDGTEAAEIILKGNDIPVLFLSSHTEREIVNRTEKITSYGYVSKDSGITVLDASIKMAYRLHDSYMNIKTQKMEIESQKEGLQLSESRYRRLFESAKDGILILDAENGMIVDVNPFLIDLLGYSKEEFLNKYIWDINAFKKMDYAKQLYLELQKKGYVRYIDLPLETSGGKLIHVECVCNVYLVDHGKVIQCNIRDIADRIRYEKTLTTDIDEKEALISEIQHRVKNSFNIITGLIHIRSRVTQSEETKNILEELAHRVNSISELYTLLYETKSIYNVNLNTYFRKIIESMLSLSDNITIHQAMDDITVSTKNAATLGMVLVEILANSVKYAFPGLRKGIINIELKARNSVFFLMIKDNGIGLKNDFDIAEIKSVGLHLVNLMISQLGGSISISSDSGTKFIIECPSGI